LALLTGTAIVAAAMAPSIGLAYVAIAAAGFLSIWLIALANTLVQLRAEPRMRGRVMGIWTMALPGTMPFTGLLTGLVAQAVGARAGFALAGVVMLATVALTWRALHDRSASPIDRATEAAQVDSRS
jgi:MFS family permease